MKSLYSMGARIRQAREAANMTQKELAEKLSYKSPSTIAKIEKGENNLTQTKIAAFAATLGVSVGYLMGDSSDETPPMAKMFQGLKQELTQAIALSVGADNDATELLTEYNALSKEAKLEALSCIKYIAHKDKEAQIKKDYGKSTTA